MTKIKKSKKMQSHAKNSKQVFSQSSSHNERRDSVYSNTPSLSSKIKFQYRNKSVNKTYSSMKDLSTASTLRSHITAKSSFNSSNAFNDTICVNIFEEKIGQKTNEGMNSIIFRPFNHADKNDSQSYFISSKISLGLTKVKK